MEKKTSLLSGELLPLVQTAEFNVGASTTSKQFSLADFINQLRNVQNGLLVGLKVQNNTSMPNSPSGAVTVSDAVIRNSTLTLTNKNQEQVLQNVPLSFFLLANQQYPIEFEPFEVDFNNSYIQQNAPGTIAPTANTSFVFTFFYRKA